MNKFRFYLAASAASLALTCVAITPVHAQDTTSSIRGTVTGDSAPLSGASVSITHVPTGTVSRTMTSADGSFGASGLRIGGPYSIKVTAEGFADAEVTDTFLTAGETFRLPLNLEGQGDAIIVTASSVLRAGSQSQGPASAFSRNDIEGVASVNRDIRDIVRRDAFATLDLTNSRAVSIAGQNPRFNRFSVDGVQFSDDFGLNNGGLPTGRGPVPLDAIGQVSVKVAPYDITAGDLQGGAIDVVLQSGTNEFQGTGFFSFTSDGLTGTRSKDRSLSLDFESRVFGATIRGPIIRDKLFFMVSGERTRETTPINIGPIGGGFGSEVQGVTSTLLKQITDITKTTYNYDVGGVISSADEKDDKLVVKLDANLSDDHRAALTYIYNQGSFYVPTGRDTNFYTGSEFSATRPQYALSSNNYLLSEKVHSGVFQLNSSWSDSFSTEARVSYRKYDRGQVPTQGANFSQFSICTDATSIGDSLACTSGVPVINVGPDSSRHFNSLSSENLSGQFITELNMNGHRVRGLFGFEHVKTFNAFLQHARGTYYFDSIADYQNRTANQLRYQGARSQNMADGAAEFRYTNFTAGVMDEWEVTPDFTLAYGVRWDVYRMNTPIPASPNVYNRLGFSNVATLGGRGVLQPRFGFNWQAADRLTVRGGGGLFAGGAPDVWVANSYQNTGIVTSSLTINRATSGAVTGGPAAGLTGVTGTDVAQAVKDAVSNASASANGSTAFIDPDLALPSQWKLSLSVDYEPDFGFLGEGWNVGGDILYSRVKNSLLVQNARLRATGATTPDGRPRYVSVVGPTDTSDDLMLTNGKDGRGIVGVVRLDKRFRNGISFGGSYTWQDVDELSPLTSSTPGSNYTNVLYQDPNFPAYGTGNDQIRWQFKYYAGFEHAFFGDYKTRFQLFGETRAGKQFSYTMTDVGGSGPSAVFGTTRTGGRHLLYVPNVSSATADPNVIYADAATFNTLQALINGSALKDYQGKTAPKNIGRSAGFTKIDLHVEQEVPALLGTSRFTLFADIENLPNLLNRNWGQLRQVAFPYQAAVVTVGCANAACTQYRYSSATTPQEVVQVRQSLYQIRVGARFTF